MGAADVEFVVGEQVNRETGTHVHRESSPPVSLCTCVRVLLVDHADFLGGAERSALELLRTLDSQKFCVTLACPPGALLDSAGAQGNRVEPLDLRQVRGLKNLRRAPFDLIAGVRALARLIRREQFDIVHSNTMRATIYAAPAAKLAGAKFVWHVRDLHRERAYLWLMSHMADAIIANARAVAETIRADAQHKTTVIYNGINLREFDPTGVDRDQFRAELGLRSEHLLIGNIGWLAPWKGQRQFIEAAARIAAQYPPARFVIVGAASDPRYSDYVTALRALGQPLGDKLIWAGERADIRTCLAALDLLLHCAAREPFGRVLVEAMAMRAPVIAFAGGGPDEIIAHGETGLLIPPHDVAAMANAAIELLARPDRRAAMGDAARARAASLFDSELSARRVETVYDQLLARH